MSCQWAPISLRLRLLQSQALPRRSIWSSARRLKVMPLPLRRSLRHLYSQVLRLLPAPRTHRCTPTPSARPMRPRHVGGKLPSRRHAVTRIHRRQGLLRITTPSGKVPLAITVHMAQGSSHHHQGLIILRMVRPRDVAMLVARHLLWACSNQTIAVKKDGMMDMPMRTRTMHGRCLRPHLKSCRIDMRRTLRVSGFSSAELNRLTHVSKFASVTGNGNQDVEMDDIDGVNELPRRRSPHTGKFPRGGGGCRLTHRVCRTRAVY